MMEPRNYFPHAVKNGYAPATVNETGGIDTYPMMSPRWCRTADECAVVCREQNEAQIACAKERLAAAQSYMGKVAATFNL